MASAGKMPSRKRTRRGAPVANQRLARNGAAAIAPVNARTVGKVLGILRRASKGWNAPVMALEAAEHGDPFRTLIGCILSLRTRDETTAKAVPRLFAQASTPHAMLSLGGETNAAPAEQKAEVRKNRRTPGNRRRSEKRSGHLSA
jgi:hypothetical protein